MVIIKYFGWNKLYNLVDDTINLFVSHLKNTVFLNNFKIYVEMEYRKVYSLKKLNYIQKNKSKIKFN